MKSSPLFILALLMALSSSVAAGMEKQTVPTVTRLVQVFTTLENALAASVQKGDAAALSKLVADDFELRVGAMPGNPTPRAEWLQRSRGNPTPPFRIEQMAVHDYGATAIVSFLWKQSPHHDIFVVDIWSKSVDAWKLSVRYASPAGEPEFPVPGAAPADSLIEKKY